MYPLPITLVGATVNGRPNYIRIAHLRVMDLGSVSLGMSKAHYTNIVTKENETFSNNIPSVERVEKTDYYGLFSCKTIEKALIFKTFYGKLNTGPIIEECPIKWDVNGRRLLVFSTMTYSS